MFLARENRSRMVTRQRTVETAETRVVPSGDPIETDLLGDWVYYGLEGLRVEFHRHLADLCCNTLNTRNLIRPEVIAPSRMLTNHEKDKLRACAVFQFTPY